MLGAALSVEEPCTTWHLKAVPYLKRKEKRVACLLQAGRKEIKFASRLLLLSRNLHSSKPRCLQASLATRLSFPQNFKNETESPCVSTASTVKTNRVCLYFCSNAPMLAYSLPLDASKMAFCIQQPLRRHAVGHVKDAQ